LVGSSAGLKAEKKVVNMVAQMVVGKVVMKEKM
jgi:hypothetical protein